MTNHFTIFIPLVFFSVAVSLSLSSVESMFYLMADDSINPAAGYFVFNQFNRYTAAVDIRIVRLFFFREGKA